MRRIEVNMNKQTEIQVIIGGRQITLSGYESGEYLQRVASYINQKQELFSKQDSYRYLDNDLKGVLMQLNIADDYFKLKKQMEEESEQNDAKSEEIFHLKHDLISLQTKLETAQQELERLKAEKLEEEKKVIRLEAELSECRKSRKKQEKE